jgi:hypothetical protein
MSLAHLVDLLYIFSDTTSLGFISELLILIAHLTFLLVFSTKLVMD